MWVSDALFAQALYRVKARLQAVAFRCYRGSPPPGDGARRGDDRRSGARPPRAYLLHGQVVIDGIVEIEGGVVIAPFVTIGLRFVD